MQTTETTDWKFDFSTLPHWEDRYSMPYIYDKFLDTTVNALTKQYALLHIFHRRGDDVQLCGVFSDHQKQRKTVVILEHKGLPILREYVRQLKRKLDFFAAKHI